MHQGAQTFKTSIFQVVLTEVPAGLCYLCQMEAPQEAFGYPWVPALVWDLLPYVGLCSSS